MQGVAVVVNGLECLQSGANVVKTNLLGVQTAATGLNMVFQFLAAVVAFVFVFDGFGPDAASHTANHRIFCVDAIAEKEA